MSSIAPSTGNSGRDDAASDGVATDGVATDGVATNGRRSVVPGPRTRPAGSLYRGREGMWSWVAHRITGVLTFFFLFAHVLDTALVRVSPESYDRVIDTYKNPLVNLLEIGLVGAVLYHALNGLRIIAIDFWSRGPNYQREMLWGILAVWIVVMVPGAFFMFQHSFEQLFGSI